MARLARYAHLSPTEFGALTPARTQTLNEHVTRMLDEEWNGYGELAKLVAMACARRL